MLRKTRIILATVFFMGITLLFLDFTGTLHHWLGWLARIQALETVMSTITQANEFITALNSNGDTGETHSFLSQIPFWLVFNLITIVVLIVITLIFGRIYCSVICPLGVMQDVIGWFGKKAKKNRYTYSKAISWLRYVMLGLFVLACIAGIGTVVQLLAPYSTFGRIATTILQPLWMLGNNVLADIAESMNSYAFYSVDVWIGSMPVLIITATTLVLLFLLAWRNGRTYCNTICPIGTVLSFLARFSWLKVHFDAGKCRNCSLCTKNCKAACIDFKNHAVDYSRCVVCGNCIESCKFGALKYSRAHESYRSHESHKPQEAPVDPGKRSFLLASAMITTAALAQETKHVDGGLADIIEKKAPKRQSPVTPPGSLSAKNMAKRCTGCLLCISECPNDVLRPSTDLMTLMQPTMSFERGYCRPECTRCSQVCPAGAIKPIDKYEKTSIQIGHAVVAADFCISAQGETECGNCARHCPAGAIEMIEITDPQVHEAMENGSIKMDNMPKDIDEDFPPMIPVVNENACIGCGACEHLCPVRPLSAIHVEGHEVHGRI